MTATDDTLRIPTPIEAAENAVRDAIAYWSPFQRAVAYHLLRLDNWNDAKADHERWRERRRA